MTRTQWRNLSVLPWLILPVMLWRYWQLRSCGAETARCTSMPTTCRMAGQTVVISWSDSSALTDQAYWRCYQIVDFAAPEPWAWQGVMLFRSVCKSICGDVPFIGVLELNALEPGGHGEKVWARRGADTGHGDRRGGDCDCESGT